jgi:hypothetical protein
MEIRAGNIQHSPFIRAGRPVSNTNPVNLNSSSINTIDPTKHNHGAISQLINYRYQHELRKDTKLILLGRRLREILNYEYSDRELESLPTPVQNLIRFHKSISGTEIIKFLQFIDDSHEIDFRDFSFDTIKFKAIFEALGDLREVEMQAGTGNYVALSDHFEIKEKVKKVFSKLKDKLKFGNDKDSSDDEQQSL